MALGIGRNATRELTRIALVLSPQRARRGGFVAWLLLAGVLGAGAAALWWSQQTLDFPLAGAMQENHQLQQQLEQARLKLGMAEAHAQELERQIDTLNQRLRESQEELTFFRKARDGKN